jgi:hypothetical protein
MMRGVAEALSRLLAQTSIQACRSWRSAKTVALLESDSYESAADPAR